MGMLSEFKEFAMKGNVIDMAVGVVIGGAFGKVVSSLVENVVMPPVGLLMGQVDFKDLSIPLKAGIVENGVVTTPPVVLRYGLFINQVVDFLIVAFAIFFVIKQMNKLSAMAEKLRASGS